MTQSAAAAIARISRLARLWERWQQLWCGSLHFRLLALGLMPLLVAFPFVVGVLGIAGGNRAQDLLLANLRAQLSSSHNYLDQLKADTRVRVSQLVKSDALIQMVRQGARADQLNTLLYATAQSSGLDYLLVARADGSVLGSSSGTPQQSQLPRSFVVEQAAIGVANAAYERLDAEQLHAYSPRFAAMARIRTEAGPSSPAAIESRGLLINAGAHFPLAVNNPDVILLGGILLNRNFALIEHMRELVFPVGSLMGDIEGLAAIYLDDANITISRQRIKGQNVTGTRAPPGVRQVVLDQGQTWIGRAELAHESHLTAFEPILNGEGQRIGMLSVAFPDGPYRESLWLMLGLVAGLLALTMLAISILFLRTARGLTSRLAAMGATMQAVGNGDRSARVFAGAHQDELSKLGAHFNTLLDRIAAQDERQRAAQRTIADESERRRALFQGARDGIAILYPDGSVLEANPKCASMLGYSVAEMRGMPASAWDAVTPAEVILASIQQVGAEGLLFETVQRRKDGSTYPAEASLSRATLSDQSFVFILQRDISERKAVEAELAQYRLELENRVEQRTRELNERSEQLNTIFELSPDGFVSFDQQLKVSFANRAFQRLTGLDASEILGLDEAAFSDRLISLSNDNAVFQGVAQLRAARLKLDTEARPSKARRRQLFELSRPVSRVLEVGVRLSDVHNVSQILYLRDVTHEIEVERLKSEFLSTAAHELRTPMASILGYSELLLSGDFEVDEQREFLTTVHRQSQLMASVINELLDLARIEARRGKDFNLERTQLQELVTQTLADFHPPQSRRPPIVTGADIRLPVKIDHKKMQQVVLNIISNAYKYSPDGSEVRVRLYSEQVDGQARACFEIQDQGIGMTAEQLGRVCERFYRADASGKILGTGLGMSIVKEIVELLRGDMELQSRPGQGTTVTIWVPMLCQTLTEGQWETLPASL